MKFHLVACGTRPPGWAAAGFDDFTRRIRRPVRVELHEIPLGRRRGGEPPDRAVEDEGQRMLKAVPRSARLVALDPKGAAWTTEELGAHLKDWLAEGSDVAFAIGGPDGLAPAVLARADDRWSLGPLTLPHMLVRVILAEQLYRAWSILENHPYHRA